jgi:hypothetical protein
MAIYIDRTRWLPARQRTRMLKAVTLFLILAGQGYETARIFAG